MSDRSRPSRLPRAYFLFDRLFRLWERVADLFHASSKHARHPSFRLALEGMEDRLVPDGGRPHPIPVIFAGAGSGSPVVNAYLAESGALDYSVQVYDSSFTGGVRVAVNDFTLDGYPDVIVAPGPGGGPNVRILDGKTGEQIDGPLGSFWAYSETFTGGVHIAAADVDGDGVPDVITAAGPGGGPHVKVFSGETGNVISSFFAYDADFDGGITVAAADLTGDGLAELAVGAGEGGGPRITVFNPLTAEALDSPIASFFAFDPEFRGGVYLGADAFSGDVNGDAIPDLAVGSGPGMVTQVKVFSGLDGSEILSLTPFGNSFEGGARVGLVYIDDDIYSDVVVGSGPGLTDTIRVFSGATGQQLDDPLGEYAPFEDETGGVFIAARNDPFTPNVTISGQTSAVEGQALIVEYKIDPVVVPPDPMTGLGGGTYYATGDVSLTVTSFTFPSTTTTWMTLTETLSGGIAYFSIEDLPALVGYSFTTDYPGDSNFMSSTAGMWAFSITSPASTAVTPQPPAPTDCSCAGPVSMGDAAIGGVAAGVSAAGVNYSTGATKVTRSDLSAGGGPLPMGQNWTYTNAANYSDGLSGTGGTQTQLPRIVQNNGDDSIAMVLNGQSALFFDRNTVTGAYQPRYFDTSVLTHDTTNHKYVLTDGTGNTFSFYDFSFSTPTGRAGRLLQMTSLTGDTTDVTSWDGSGRPLEVQQVVGSGGSAVTTSFLSTYIASGTNAGLLETVTQRQKVGTGSWSTVRTTEYAYYDGSTSHGLAGELKTAVVKDASANVLDQSYYRYYGGSGGSGLMKFAFGPAAYSRLTAALGTSLDSLSDNDIAPYADKYLEYDSSGRVTAVTDAAAGCSACSGGLGEFTYSYSTNSSFSGVRSPNKWMYKTVETLPDNNTNTVYTNIDGQILLHVYEDATTNDQWITYNRYDDDGRLILTANPSAVTGFSESYLDLVNVVSGNAGYLSDSSGLITTYTYATTTTATTSTAGDAKGYLTSVAIQRGETGTTVPQSSRTYLETPTGTFVSASSTAYRNDDGTGGQTTTASYTWQGSTAQPASVTVTMPTVTTAQNGSNSATSMTSVFDSFGRVIWSKDAGGFLGYFEYDSKTGAVVKSIQDVDHTATSDFANLPSGWTTPSGGGLHLITTYEVDSLGRTTKVTHPDGQVDYTVYNDANHEVRYYPGWNSTTNAPTGPTMVSREDLAGNYSESLTMSATPNVSSGRPTGTESIASLQSLSRTYRNDAGQAVYSDSYFNLSGLTYSTSTSLGTSGTNFYRTESVYDKQGRLAKTVTPQGTIYRTEFDGQGRAVSEWVGTDDVPTTGYWSPSNLTGTNMVKVREYEYDGGGVGDGNLTKVTEIPAGGAADRVTQTFFDWRNRAVATKSGVETSESTSVNRPIMYTDYDNLGQVTKTRMYDGDTVTITSTSGVPNAPSSSLLRAQTTTSFDELGRAYRSDVYSVDPSSGSVGSNTLYSLTWFDARGQVIKTAAPGGLVQKMSYDGIGRTTVSYTTDGGGDSGYSDADDVTGDIVLDQTEYTYDDGSKVLSVLTRERFHDASGTGALGTSSSGIGARVSYAGYYYDAGGRSTAVVNVGTNGGSSWTRPGTVPSRSDTVLVTSYTFDDAGRVFEVTDPRGLVNRTYYDALGRTTKTIENYVDGTVSDADDKTVEYTYNAAGMTSLTAKLTGGGGQTTEWVYGITTGGGNGITSNDVVGATKWPDPSTGAASSSEQETVTLNALGQTVTGTDRNGSVHSLTYDVLGRIVTDAVTTLGSGVDGSVRRIETAYDSQMNAHLITSYDAVTGGNIVNQIQRAFNGLGQMITEWQSHSGAVNTSTTPKVQYAYSEMTSGANHSRPTSMTYPSGYVLTFNYSSGLNSNISRLSSLSDSTGTLESYSFLGLGTVVIRSHPQPTIDLTYVKQSGESNGDAGDQYTGLDRFGRVVDQSWINTTSSTASDRFQYGYDRDSNRLFRDNLVNTAFGELYSYDGLNQLISFDRGTLNGSRTAITGTVARSQDWDYDALGNFDSVTTDGGSPATRTANAQNEITSISGATTPTYDANGNMTGDETGKTFVYDAWNRLMTVKNGSTTLTSYQYDGTNRRVSENPGTARDLYYSAGWQVLEERVAGVTEVQYVWSLVYIDAMILRDRDTDANGSLDERLWVQQDANWNVTAIVDGSGTVQERYAYDAYGVVTIYSATYAVRANSLNAMTYLFQGRPLDSITGNYDNRMRWYDPNLGVWISIDPIGFTAGDQRLYGFVANNPANYTDPNGLMPPPPLPPGVTLPTTSPIQGVTPQQYGWIKAGLDKAIPLDKVKANVPPDALQKAIDFYQQKGASNLNEKAGPAKAFNQARADFLRGQGPAPGSSLAGFANRPPIRPPLIVRLSPPLLLAGGMIWLAEEGTAPPPDHPVSPLNGGKGCPKVVIPPNSILIKQTNTLGGTIQKWKTPDGTIIEIEVPAGRGR